jgi:hypothetical protein
VNTSSADWAAVLDRIRQSLDETLAAVELPPEPVADPSRPAFGADTVERLGQRLADLQTRAARARQQAQQLEALLTFEVESLNAWLAAAADVKQQLARAAGRAVS